MEALLLARIQFAANISFHILFPTITIALAWILLFFKIQFNRTGDQKWMLAYQLWVKIFALTFAFGVVSGITMSFQFGTNWPGFMQTVGNIAGPLLAYEVLTAFFLEASFLGVMLFGYGRVSNRVHTLATFLVAFGTLLSAFWILVLNSWMHTPAGFHLIDGVVHASDWLAIVFNPSLPYRLSHMLIASGLTSAFLIAGLSAYRWLAGDRERTVYTQLKVGLYLAAALIPLQILVGDMHGLNTFKHQPAKIAAIEAVWETERGAPLLLFALPNSETRSNDYAIGIPKLASFILTHDPNGEIQGLNSFVGKHPPVAPVFWAFRVMVGTGMLMLVVSFYGAYCMRRHNTVRPWFARIMVGMTFSGWVATLAGWYVTEIGRQPFLVTNVLTTAEAASNASTALVATSLGLYLALYVGLIAVYLSVVFYLARNAGGKAAPKVNGSEIPV